MLSIRQSQLDSMRNASSGVQMIAPCPANSTWIEVRLVDRHQKPVPGQKYRIRLPDSSLMEGSLDEDGKMRFDNIMPGQAEITFPDLDGREWAAASDAPADSQ